MNPLIVLALAFITVVAVKRWNSGAAEAGAARVVPAMDAGLERWRFIAIGVGVLGPYSEILLRQLGPGIYLQERHALLWSLPLQPLYAALLAVILGVLLRQAWDRLYPAVLTGSLLTVLAGMLTEEGVMPLALLARDRIGLGWLHTFDPVIIGLAGLGAVMILAFRPFDRDMARLTLTCMGAYILASGALAWQAGRVGEAHAAMLKLPAARVTVQPGPGLPLNWDVLITEPQGELHQLHLKLYGRPAGEMVAGDASARHRYLPVDEAMWQRISRFSGMEPAPVPVDLQEGPDAPAAEEATDEKQDGTSGGRAAEPVAEKVLTATAQRKVRLAWYAWQATPFSWYGRHAVFYAFADKETQPLLGRQKGCVQFRDVDKLNEAEAAPSGDVRSDTLETLRQADGDFVVCPAVGSGRSRVYRFERTWLGGGPNQIFGPPVRLRELIPVFGVRATV